MTTNDEFEDVAARLDHYLLEHKQRRTVERKEILRQIYLIDGHFTATMLHELMQGHFQVSLATVYNSLDLFTKLDIIVRHQFSNDVVEYERFSRNQTHHHRVCTECGTVKEFSDVKMRRAINNREFPSFHTTHFSLYLYGVCKKCQKKRGFRKKKM